MSSAEKGFTILGGDPSSTLFKHFFLLDQLGLVYLFGWVGFCWGFVLLVDLVSLGWLVGFFFPLVL